MESRADSPTPDELITHATFVRRLAFALVGDAQEAEDVAQETFLRALQRPPTILATTKAWLAGVTRNVVRMRRRSEARRTRRETAAACAGELPSVADTAATLEVVRRVTDAVDDLDEPYRTTLLQRHYEGLMPAEIARRTGTPVKTVKTRLNRAHAILRARLDSEHGDRRAWAPLLLPFAKRSSAGLAPVVSGALLMTLKTKLTLAVAAAAIVLTAVFLSLDRGEPATTPAEPGDAPFTGSAGPAPETEPEPAEPAPETARTEPSDALAGDTGLLRIAVVDAETGAPVPHAVVYRYDLAEGDFLDLDDEVEVSLLISECLEGEERTSSTPTDTQGKAAWAVPPGPAVLLVRHPRYRDAAGARFPLAGGDERTVELRLVPYPEGEREIEFGGTVTDGVTTWPLDGVAIECRYREDGEIRRLTTRTGEAGRWKVRVPANAGIGVRFTRDGYEPHVIGLNPVHETWRTGDVSLLPVNGGPRRGEGRLTGRITDAATGEPVAGAELTLARGLTERGGGIGDWGGWQSDSDGRYVIDLKTVDDAEEWMRLTVRAPGYAEFRSDLVSIAPDRTTAYPVALARADADAALTGTVVDGATDGPVRGARVLVVDVFDDPVAATATDANGRFSLVPRGDGRRLVVRAKGYAEFATDLDEEPEARTFAVALARADARVAGTITDAATGTPLAGVTLSLYVTPEWSGPERATTTDEAGAYSFDVAPGRYLVQARLEGYGTEYGGPVEAVSGKTSRADVALHPTDCLVSGRVRDAATGEELPRGAADVFLLRLPTGVEDELVCEMAGYHEPVEVESQGARYSARLVPGRYEVSIGLRGYLRLEREILLRPGERLVLDLEIRPMPAADSVVRGRVVDAAGEPVADLPVFLQFEGTHYAQTGTDPEGRFEFTCPAGAVRVTCGVQDEDDFVTFEAVAETRSGEATEVVIRIGK